MKLVIIIILSFIYLIPIKSQTWTNYTTKNGLASNWVYSISIDKQGNYWFGTNSGLNKFDGTKWQTWSHSNGLPNVYVTAFDSSENLWLGTIGYGLDEYNGTSFTTYTTSNNLASNNVFTIAFDNKGNKWIGTDNGISEFGKVGWHNYNVINDGLISNSITKILIDSYNNAWCGTDSGFSIFDGTFWTNYTVADGLANNYIMDIAIDSAGNKWFATYGGGVSEYNDTLWNNYDQSNGLSSDYVLCIAIDSHGNKWFGTQGGGVSMFDGYFWTTFNIGKGSSGSTVHSIAIDAQGNKWFATEGDGVYKLNNLYLYLSTDSINITSTSYSSDSVNISSNTTWKVSNLQNWLNVKSDTGSNNKYVTFIATANNNDSVRTDTVIFTGSGVGSKRLIITQSAYNTGLNIQSVPDFNVYPNPADKNLNIEVPSGLIGSDLELISLNGDLLYSSKIISNHSNIDMSVYNPGMYFIKIITSGNGIAIRKIIVSR